MADLKNLPLLIIGAGEMASGVAHRLFKSGFRVMCTEMPDPLCVRRSVSFCEAVHEGTGVVEGVTSVMCLDMDQANKIWADNHIPVMVDPELTVLSEYRPRAVIEASLAKDNLVGLNPGMAELVIALGPGFSAPQDAHFVIETNRGHNLGRVITSGCAAPNTGVPGDIEGHSWDRVFRAPVGGLFDTDRKIGDLVRCNDEVGKVGKVPVLSQLDGMIRGLIRPGTKVTSGLKLGDVDPRGANAHPDLISEKARALGGSVLECLLMTFNT